jgi:hypothetical protein
MMRFSLSVLAIASSFAVVSIATAGDKDQHGRNGSGWQQQNSQSGIWGGVSQIVSQSKQHHSHKSQPQKKPIPIDPGRGDGRVPVTPPPVVRDHRDGSTSQGGGFVFVNGHWERVKAPPKTNPYPTGTVVRDHRGESYPGGTIVRDHRTPRPTLPPATIVRDHRESAASGGTTVTTTKPWTVNDGPVIRDHRTTPIVRDHRTTPVVRDHRTTTK